MSSGKHFEKTFSRKKKKENSKKNNGSRSDEDEVPLTTLITKAQRQSETSKNTNNGCDDQCKLVNGGEEPRKKNKVSDSPKPRPNPNPNPKQDNQDKQKQPRKLENGEGEREEGKKKKKTTMAAQNSDNLKKKEKEKEQEKEEESSDCTFATNRIVRIIKSEGSDYRLSQEAIFLINKSTEKFIELFSEYAYDCAVQDRKSFVSYKHLSSVASKEKRFDFLSDFVPEKVTAEKALAERKPAETLPG